MFMQISFYSFTLWLGIYLIARDLKSTRLRLAGLGLVSYALAIAVDFLATQASSQAAEQLLQLHWAMMLFPPTLWAGAVLGLMPGVAKHQNRLSRIWQQIMVPIVSLSALLFVMGIGLWSAGGPTPVGILVFGALSLQPLVALLILLPHLKEAGSSRRALGLVIVATLFFTLGIGIMLLSSGWIPRSWALVGIGLDMILLGIAVVNFDAFERGEALVGDFLRSLAISTLIVLVFGGQVAFAISISTGATLTMTALLLATITAALLLQGFAVEIQRLVDKLVFNRMPRLRRERSVLREVASALPKAKRGTAPNEMSEKAFYQATRWALSHFNTLPKLAVNPLNALPEVSQRLEDRKAPDNTLERTQELKNLLTESIERLKPDPAESFGTSDAWRYYNALYFPYVAGLRVYSRNAIHDSSDPVNTKALEWFQVYVPERTLYNWQAAAARLVAQDLWEQMKA